jgi:hypothetical protein
MADRHRQSRAAAHRLHHEHATISLAMLKAKNQQPQQDQQYGTQWPGTDTFGPTNSSKQTGDEWGVY